MTTTETNEDMNTQPTFSVYITQLHDLRWYVGTKIELDGNVHPKLGVKYFGTLFARAPEGTFTEEDMRGATCTVVMRNLSEKDAYRYEYELHKTLKRLDPSHCLNPKQKYGSFSWSSSKAGAKAGVSNPHKKSKNVKRNAEGKSLVSIKGAHGANSIKDPTTGKSIGAQKGAKTINSMKFTSPYWPSDREPSTIGAIGSFMRYNHLDVFLSQWKNADGIKAKVEAGLLTPV